MKLSLSPNVLEKLKFGSVLEKLKFGSQLFRFVNFYSQLHTHLMAYYAKTGHSRPPPNRRTLQTTLSGYTNCKGSNKSP